MREIQQYIQAITQGYMDKGLTKEDAEKRAALTIRIAELLEQRQQAGDQIRQRGGAI